MSGIQYKYIIDIKSSQICLPGWVVIQGEWLEELWESSVVEISLCSRATLRSLEISGQPEKFLLYGQHDLDQSSISIGHNFHTAPQFLDTCWWRKHDPVSHLKGETKMHARKTFRKDLWIEWRRVQTLWLGNEGEEKSERTALEGRDWVMFVVFRTEQASICWKNENWSFITY